MYKPLSTIIVGRRDEEEEEKKMEKIQVRPISVYKCSGVF